MVPPLRSTVLASFVALLLTGGGCARPKHALTPLELADATTRAVYQGDSVASSRYFDPRLRRTVTARSVTAVSRLMHRYGDYQGIAQTVEVAKGVRYDFEAQFSHGSMLVQMRLDPSRRTIVAYRVVPNGP